MARAPAGRTALRGVLATGSYQVTFVRLACLGGRGKGRQVRLKALGRWITGSAPHRATTQIIAVDNKSGPRGWRGGR
jgi:hypothetical protein